jgi:hypothetical protein
MDVMSQNIRKADKNLMEKQLTILCHSDTFPSDSLTATCSIKKFAYILRSSKQMKHHLQMGFKLILHQDCKFSPVLDLQQVSHKTIASTTLHKITLCCKKTPQ